MFFATPWHNNAPDSADNNSAAPDRSPLCDSSRADPEQLHIGLPARFRPILDVLLQTLPSQILPLDNAGWPMVRRTAPTYSRTHLRGARDGPHRTRLWPEGHRRRPARHVFLGSREPAQLAHLSNQLASGGRRAPASGPPSQRLQVRVLAVESVEAARLLDVFLKFGFELVDASTRQPLQEASRGLAFLEAITLMIDMDENK